MGSLVNRRVSGRDTKLMSPFFCIVIVLCTISYFYVMLWQPKLFAVVIARALGQLWLCGSILGVSALLFLGCKEAFYIVASYRLGTAYDNYIGLSAFVLAALFMEKAQRRLR